MGRYLSTALLTGLSNGLGAATVSILWCHTMAHMRENKKKLPDLLYNIRHGENAHMFFPSESLFVSRIPCACKHVWTHADALPCNEHTHGTCKTHGHLALLDEVPWQSLAPYDVCSGFCCHWCDAFAESRARVARAQGAPVSHANVSCVGRHIAAYTCYGGGHCLRATCGQTIAARKTP